MSNAIRTRRGATLPAVAMLLVAAACARNPRPAEPVVIVPQPAPPVSPTWSYDGSTGPEFWADLSPDYMLCATGTRQSPINLSVAEVRDLPPLVLDYNQGTTVLSNDGLTLKANFTPGNRLSFKGTDYQLEEIVFHHPSEHLMQGQYATLEFQLVHKSADGKHAIVGVMVKEGMTRNVLLDSLLLGPKMKYGADRTTVVNPAQLLPDDRTFYMYDGSLTTPPCTEGVKWFIFANEITATRDQISELARLFNRNARPIHPLGNRVLIRSQLDR